MIFDVSELITPSGIRLHYQIHGTQNSPYILLIMGLGAQMTVWPDNLIQYLLSQGFCVIRFDNRDVGLSSKLDECGRPNLLTQALKQRFHLKTSTPYSLDDMAEDVIELMNGLRIDQAHIVGASMGGMIGQIIASRFKKRCASLVSVMSSSGNPKLPKAKLKTLWQILRHHQSKKHDSPTDALIEKTIHLNRVMSGSAFKMNEQELRHMARSNLKRGHHPSGFQRQLAAIHMGGSRVPLLRKIKVPTLVIHGSEDPLIPIQAALDTAINIPKAKFRIVHGMGHNIPTSLGKPLGKMIAKHAKKADIKARLKSIKKNKLPNQRRRPRTA